MLPAQEDAGPYAMRYGAALTTTVDCGGRSGTTLKGLVVRCGDRGAVVFDTELLRLSAAWADDWLRLRGTAYDGSHGPMPSRRGRLLVETAPGPGWAHERALVDPRPIPHGPLPHEWGRFGGYRLSGERVVVGYRVGDMSVRETFALDGEPCTLTRTLELGPSAAEQLMVVLDGPGDQVGGGVLPERLAMLQWQPVRRGPVELDAAKTWDRLLMGGPSNGDYLDAASGTGATIVAVPGFARPRGEPGDLVDGGAPGHAALTFAPMRRGDDDVPGRLYVDLQHTVELTRVHTFSCPEDRGGTQRFVLFGWEGKGERDGEREGEAVPDPAADDVRDAGWREIARVDGAELAHGQKHASAIVRPEGLGRWRHLLFVVQNGDAPLCEIDVFADRFQAAVDAAPAPQNVVCALHGDTGPELVVEADRMLLRVPAHDATLRLQLVMARGDDATVAAAMPALTLAREVPALATGPAPLQWGPPITTRGHRAADDGPFAVDTITIPFDNPFHSRMRTAAFDFFADGRAAVSTWNGDVWIVDGIDDALGELHWRRFATGLFDPLGLRIVDDVVHVLGRDGITRLHDHDGNGEADEFECFHNDVLITSGFHEFAFDLQTDADGNFYFSKGAPVKPGGRGFMKIVPHNGTILKVAKDGSRIEAIATGLRAPNGIGVSPTGIVTSGDNEGTFMPRCRINWFTEPGFYGGVKDTAHRSPVPEQPDLPLCWMPMDVDNSSGGQVWVTGNGWQDLDGRLLHLSYGTCSVFLVLTEEVDGHVQGGVVRLPAEFSSSCMRGRFSPRDGQLYVIGLQGWQTSAAREGGFHRVRRTEAPLGLPIALRTCTQGVYLTFAEPLDEVTAGDADSFGVEIWNYRYSPNYGSPEVSLLHPERQVAEGKPNRDTLAVTGAKLSPDRRTVFLAVDGMRAVHQMRVTWNVDTADGRMLKGELHNTIHALAADPGFPQDGATER